MLACQKAIPYPVGGYGLSYAVSGTSAHCPLFVNTQYRFYANVDCYIRAVSMAYSATAVTSDTLIKGGTVFDFDSGNCDRFAWIGSTGTIWLTPLTPPPDMSVINYCEETTGFSAVDAANNLTTSSTRRFGNYSISIDKTNASTYGSLRLDLSPAISLEKFRYVGLFVYNPGSDLTDIKVFVNTYSSPNGDTYYSPAITPKDSKWNFVVINLDSPSNAVRGKYDRTNITRMGIVNYTASTTAVPGILFDLLMAWGRRV